MGYVLGIDLGTTWTAAAVERDGRVDIVGLGNRHAVVPSVVFLKDDEEVLIGEAAQRRASTEPDRVAREFKRRIGDPTPILVGTTPYSAEALSAKVLRWVVDRVAEREGGAADDIIVTHPANWGAYKQDLLAQAIRIADLGGNTTMITEPEAAALYYASNERVDTGAVVAVFDLGGGTFDAAILRKSDSGFEVLGQPEGIERLGGIDFDEAVFQHVMRSLGDAAASLDPDDPQVSAAVARVRQECVDAKEALAGDTDVSIPVVLPSISTEVRLTRGEFESMIRPSLTDTIGAMRRAISGANINVEEVATVLLVGGSSRIPLVAQMVGSELGRPVAVDAHPKYAVAMGAALAAGSDGAGGIVGVVGGGAGGAAVAGAALGGAAAAGAVVGGAAVAGAAAAGAAMAGGGEPEPVPKPAPEPVAEPVSAPTSEPPPPVAPPPEPAPVAPTQEMSPAAVAAATAAAASVPPVAAAASAPPAATPPPPGAPPVAPGTGGGDSSDGNARLIKLGLAALLVIAAFGVGFVAFGGGGDDAASDATTTAPAVSTTAADASTTSQADTATTAAPVTTTTAAATTTSTIATTTTAPCVGVCARIDAITIVGTQYSVAWTPTFTPSIATGDHGHFYFSPPSTADTVSSDANPSSPWEVADTLPFEGLALANKPAEATEICVTPANISHVVINSGNFDCMAIPAG